MVEFIIAIIEWFAVLSLSSIGIDASDVDRCASAPAARPAEYRETVMVVGDVDGKSGWTRIRDVDCSQWVPIRDPRAVPELLSPPLVYNS